MSAEQAPIVASTLDTAIAGALVSALAIVRAVSEAEIAALWAADGDVEIASVEAEAVVIFVETALGVEDLCEVADLEDDQRTSLLSLGSLLQSKQRLVSV